MPPGGGHSKSAGLDSPDRDLQLLVGERNVTAGKYPGAQPEPANSRTVYRFASLAPPTDGLLLIKLACQAVFVISFYDLSRTGYRATVQRCTDAFPCSGSSPFGVQDIDKGRRA